jgi:hypothetical protein
MGWGGHNALCPECIAGIADNIAIGGNEDVIDRFGAKSLLIGVLNEKSAAIFGENFGFESSRSVSGWYDYDCLFQLTIPAAI